jgi:hypothetical protein
VDLVFEVEVPVSKGTNTFYPQRTDIADTVPALCGNLINGLPILRFPSLMWNYSVLCCIPKLVIWRSLLLSFYYKIKGGYSLAKSILVQAPM